MDEALARSIFNENIDIDPDDGLWGRREYIVWECDENSAVLDGYFSPDELEAIAWWMKNKRKEHYSLEWKEAQIKKAGGWAQDFYDENKIQHWEWHYIENGTEHRVGDYSTRWLCEKHKGKSLGTG